MRRRLSLRWFAATLVLAFALLGPARAEAATSVTLAWDASSDTTVTGYLLYYGPRSGSYTGQVDVGKATQFTLLGIPAGTYYFVLKAYNASGMLSGASNEVSTAVTDHYLAATKAPDFDGDGRTDPVVWRAATGAWDYLSSSTNLTNGALSGVRFGSGSVGDIPLSGDVDGDHKADLIVYRSTTGVWYWLTSSSGFTQGGSTQWGVPSLGDKPMMADIDGDGLDDIVIWRPYTGVWYWLTSSSGYNPSVAGSLQFGSGTVGDIPMMGDFNGDGRADVAVWRPTDGTFYWWSPASATGGSKQWGVSAAGDIPMIGDLDGDHRSDLVVWRPGNGTFYWLLSSLNYSASAAGSAQWGYDAVGDKPALADMDGDRKADLVVWRTSTGEWFWLKSSSGYSPSNAGYGKMTAASPGDVPVVK
jgi:hypothetical protein